LLRAVLGVVLATGLAACTHHGKPSAKPSRSPSASSAPAAPASVPMQVRVTRVLGRLPHGAEPALEANVGKTISAYLDDAFLGGSYPRSDFSDAFASFTKGAADQARGDRTLLTNASYGASTTAVRATRRSAYLSVLAPNRVAAGVTARVDLVLRVDRGDQPAEQVHLTGRLLLTRDSHNAWVIFGYELARSDTPAGGGS
jgi:hypothetical protein